MNSLVIFADEGWDLGPIRLVGARAESFYNSQQFKVGQEIHVAKLGADKGIARVVCLSSSLIELDLVSSSPSLPLKPIDLVVGLSRPQTLKKVIQAATMVGVRSLHFVHTESGEKSYLTSHLLRPDALQLEVVKSLEQIWEGLYPSIHIHRSFRYFVSHHLANLGVEPPGMRLVASPDGGPITTSQLESSCGSMVIAVGPEAGWSAAEVATFCTQGFQKVGLGPRVVRVEVALLMLLGQVLLARFE